jgi:hypothetical protein
MNFIESDMYLPIKAHFEKLGFEVKGEVKGLDVALLKDGEIWAVEMKKGFNITLIYQALKRQQAANAVFVAIPRKAFMARRGPILHICEKLNLGLISVAMDSPMHLVEVHLVPNLPKGRNTKASRAVIAEFSGRNFDDNIGGVKGSKGAKLMTAYKERCIQIAAALKALGAAAPAALVRDHNCPQQAGQILRNNTYGWFKKIEKGIYGLSDEGAKALNNPSFAAIVEFYSKDL